MADYYGRLTRLWDELASQEVVPTCSTGGSGCPVSRFFEASRAQDRLHRFLIGLDKRYTTLRSTILAQDLLPTVTRAYQCVAQEEQLRAASASSSPTDAVAYTLASRSTSRPSAAGLTCFHLPA